MNLTESAGGLAGATPYGAAIGAAAGVLNSALQDTPTNVTSGAGAYQAGPFTVGVRQVGGKGNSAGATTASATQDPSTPAQQLANAVGGKQTLWVIIGAAVLIVFGFLLLRPRKKR